MNFFSVGEYNFECLQTSFSGNLWAEGVRWQFDVTARDLEIDREPIAPRLYTEDLSPLSKERLFPNALDFEILLEGDLSWMSIYFTDHIPIKDGSLRIYGKDENNSLIFNGDADINWNGNLGKGVPICVKCSINFEGVYFYDDDESTAFESFDNYVGDKSLFEWDSSRRLFVPNCK